MTVPDAWRSAALAPLWHALHRRLSTGLPVSRVRIGPLDDAQRTAVADLLGLDRLPPPECTVSVARLDTVLTDAVGADTRAVVAELLGPLGDRAAERARAAEQRSQLWRWLAGRRVVTAQPVLRAWVDQQRRTGLVNGSVERTRERLEQALAVLDLLPGEGDPLQSIAERAVHDPHALDDGAPLGAVVLRALAIQFGLEPPASADDRRELWHLAGVSVDQVSTLVLAAGLRPHGAELPARLARACAEAGHAAALTLAQLRTVERLAIPDTQVWVVENPSVLAEALRRFGPSCPPLVCTAGWPSSAGILLLRLLAASGAVLRYHGDLDGEGIRIAAYVLAKTGARPWRMSTGDYLAALRARPEGPDAGRVSDAPWDPELAPALERHRIAVVEERVTDLLLDDLRTSRRTTPSE